MKAKAGEEGECFSVVYRRFFPADVLKVKVDPGSQSQYQKLFLNILSLRYSRIW